MEQQNQVQKPKKKFVIAIFLVLFVLIIVGFTVAYNVLSFKKSGDIASKVFKATYTTSFTAPEEWKPGESATTNFKVRNDSNINVVARAKIEQSWVDSNGNTLSNQYNSQDVVSLDLDGHWGLNEDDGYYYYYGVLTPEGETESLINEVTFEDVFGGEVVCMDYTTDYQRCAIGGEYGNGEYSLTVIFEVIQSDAYESEWNVNIENLTYNISIPAINVTYDNTNTGVNCSNVQCMIDYLNNKLS